MKNRETLRTALRKFDLELLEKYASSNDLEAEDEIGWTPLFYGVAANNAPAVKLLLQMGANKRHLDMAGCTPEAVAMLEGKPRLAEIIRRF